MSKPISNVTGARYLHVGIEGAGAANPTKRYGDGVTVTRTSEGLLRFSFDPTPGTFLGLVGAPVFGDTTPADVKAHSCTRDTYVDPTSSARGYVELAMFDDAKALDDLEATETLDVTFLFQE